MEHLASKLLEDSHEHCDNFDGNLPIERADFIYDL